MVRTFLIIFKKGKEVNKVFINPSYTIYYIYFILKNWKKLEMI